MTEDKLEKAKELQTKMRKLLSFCNYYTKYKMSIHLDNPNEGNYHSETFHIKEEDGELQTFIHDYIRNKYDKLQKEFDSL
jgi:hypothetical protein